MIIQFNTYYLHAGLTAKVSVMKPAQAHNNKRKKTAHVTTK